MSAELTRIACQVLRAFDLNGYSFQPECRGTLEVREEEKPEVKEEAAPEAEAAKAASEAMAAEEAPAKTEKADAPAKTAKKGTKKSSLKVVK